MIPMAEVRLTMEEYLALTKELERMGVPLAHRPSREAASVGRKKKRVGKKDPKMARALRKANQMGRKKSGGFKKGYSQARIMKKAHQLRRKM